MSTTSLVSRKRNLPKPLDLSSDENSLSGKRKRLTLTKANLFERSDSHKLSDDCLSPTDAPRVFPGSEESRTNCVQLDCATDSQIGPYLVLTNYDCGGFAHAIHATTQRVRLCQLLTHTQYSHVLAVTNRLHSVPTNCLSDEERELVLPRELEVVTDSKCRRVCVLAPDHGSLHTYVQNNNLNEQQIRRIYVQIVRIVAVCHAAGIVIRDLKLRKFVFSDEAKTRIRLASVHDLVVCVDLQNDQLNDRHGCPAYVSPEILDLQRESYSGRAADMWSLGVLLFVMFVGRYPFYDTTATGLFDKIRQARFCVPDVDMSMEAKIVLHGLLRPDPDERPSAQQLLALPWLQSRQSRPIPSTHHHMETTKDQTVPIINNL